MRISNFIVSFSIAIISLITIVSCKKENATNTDNELYEMAKNTSNFTWFKNSSSLLNKSTGTGHSQPFLRTRYNSSAATVLDANGKIKIGASFPDGSLIVKELYDNASTLSRYAILYKKSNNKDADTKGWVWGYINADGSIAKSVTDKGNGCISCHSQSDNIDYMLMNKYFP